MKLRRKVRLWGRERLERKVQWAGEQTRRVPSFCLSRGPGAVGGV